MSLNYNTIIIEDIKYFNYFIISNNLILIDFWAPWCGPCKTLFTVIDKIAKLYLYSVLVVKVNVEINPYLLNHYKICSLPTLILFIYGKIINLCLGNFFDYDVLIQINKYL